MKILLVSDYAVPRGGNEVVTLALRDGLKARGHDVRLFASRVSYKSPASSQLSITVSARRHLYCAVFRCGDSSATSRSRQGSPDSYLTSYMCGFFSPNFPR